MQACDQGNGEHGYKCGTDEAVESKDVQWTTIHGRIAAMSPMPKYAPRSAGRVRLSLRRSGMLAALLLALVTLTGCVTVQLNATVHPDGTLSGTARVGVSKTLSSLAGGGDAIRQQLRNDESCDFGAKNGTVTDFDDGTYIGIECTFSGVTMAEFNSGEDGPKLAKNGDQFQLSGKLNLLDQLNSASGLLGGGSTGSGGSGSATAPPALPSGFPTDLSSLLPSGLPTDLGSFLPSGLPTDLNSLLPSDLASQLASGLPSGALPSTLPSGLLPSGVLPSGVLPSGGLPSLDPGALLKTAKIQFAFSFPGKVTSSKGKISGHTVTFTPDPSGNIDFSTVASAKPSSSGPGAALWLPIALVVLLALAVLAVLLRKRRSRRAEPALAGAYPAPGFGPPGADGYPQTAPYPPQPYQPQPYQPQPYQSQPYPDQAFSDQAYPDQPPYQSQLPHQPPPPHQPPQPYQSPQPTEPFPSQPPYQAPEPTGYQPPGPWGQPPPQGAGWDRPAEPPPSGNRIPPNPDEPSGGDSR